MIKRTTTLLLLAAIGVGSFGCVAQTERDDLVKQVRVRDDQIAELKARIQELQEEIRILQLANSDAAAMRDAINAANADLERYKQLLAQAQAELAKKAGDFSVRLPSDVDAALQRLALQNPGLMTYDPKRGMIRFASDLTFDLGKITVKPEAAQSLQQLAGIINSEIAMDYDVRVEGHTDDVPVKNPANVQRFGDNWGLSAFRAISVMKVLESSGVAPGRMIVSGRGETKPIVPSQGIKGTRANRRVEIYLVPRPADDAAPAPGTGVTDPADEGTGGDLIPDTPDTGGTSDPVDDGPELFK